MSVSNGGVRSGLRAAGILVFAFPVLAQATPDDPYRITKREKAACAADAARLCWSTYPDESELLGCMKSNRPSLTQTCRVVFEAGLHRRRLD